MQRLMLLICFLFISIIYSQSKISSELYKSAAQFKSKDEILVWIFFTDKGTELNKLASPEEYLSKKSIERRAKVNEVIDISDLPVKESYIQALTIKGFRLKHKSKWFNAVSGYVRKSALDEIQSYPFVKKIDIVQTYRKMKDVGDQDQDQEQEKDQEKEQDQDQELMKNTTLNYGTSITQLQQINVPAVHDLGFSGEGVTICLMDAGFSNLQHEVFANMKIIAKWDFVNNDADVGDDTTQMGEGSHGTATLSVIGGYKEGELIGPAYNANYILTKTENTDSETPIEEDNWIAALEWADSIGVDVTSTSLGYLGFDSAYSDFNYTWESMDGNTARITIAADLAVKKGICVVNSAGNEGENQNHNTLNAPADGDSVITVGAVSKSGIKASFSSIGPTVDGRIKPDIMAMGVDVKAASSNGKFKYYTPDGTSFSCPLAAGVVALILQAHPDFTPIQVREALRNTASQHTIPDNYYGWGIIDAMSALNYDTANTDPDLKIKDFKLFQNYPNPFNPNTKIKFEIPENSFVNLELLNILGEKVVTLENSYLTKGVYVRELNIQNLNLASGPYLVRMNAGNFGNTIKIMVVK